MGRIFAVSAFGSPLDARSVTHPPDRSRADRSGKRQSVSGHAFGPPSGVRRVARAGATDQPSIRSWSRTFTVSPASFPIAFRTSALTGSLWVPSPIAMALLDRLLHDPRWERRAASP